MVNMLYDMKPTDPLVFGSVAFILTAAALFASYLPARRAVRVGPLIVLRDE
jgi:ABC-type lipoprotein release transport system permease subunit